MTQHNFQALVNLIWSVADLLRGDYKQSDYGKVILPMTVLRRLDCVLDGKEDAVAAEWKKVQAMGLDQDQATPMLNRVTGVPFHNVSKLNFQRLLDDPNNIATNLTSYIHGFSGNARRILDYFRFEEQIDKLDDPRTNLLFLVVKNFAEVDLHPDVIKNDRMGTIFEELIRRFAEQSNETAGEHFTPREVIRLMVNLLFIEDDDVLRQKGVIKTLYDPACGTGGMLSVAEEYLRELNPDADLQVYGQELNNESYAICLADMLLKGQDPDNIKYGNSFSEDGLPGHKFDYLLSNPPFGVDWKKVKRAVEDEHTKLGYAGRFGAGTPRINDGSLLFLQHMISKMKRPEQGGSRLAIVFNGSPLFTGAAGSGESEIRRWIIENDWLEAIVAMPDQLFYNTGILTYIWVLTNRKSPQRKGKVQLINAVDLYEKMRKSLGNKRNFIPDAAIVEITRVYGEFRETDRSKIFDNEDFGFRRIVVERPLRLNFQASPERIDRLDDERNFQKLAESKKKDPAKRNQEIAEGRALQEEIKEALAGLLDAECVYLDAQSFRKDVRRALKTAGLNVGKPLVDAIVSALSERDESAKPVEGRKGQVEADSGLRDYENVPLKEDVEEYFDREVVPHVPDAWIEHDKTKVGYEIPFTRHFYVYTPPRPLKEIEAEILALESDIQGMLGEVLTSAR